MTDQGVRTSNLAIKIGVSNTSDRLMFIYNAANSLIAQTATITVASLFANVPNIIMKDIRSVDPVNSTFTNTIPQGTLYFTNDFGYYAIANGVLRRWPLSDF